MTDQFMQVLLRRLPFGYAFHRLLLNGRGEAEDSLFLDVNSAFEKMTGLLKGSVIGKKATEVFAGVKAGSFHWTAFYADAVSTGETRETTQFIDIFQKWFKVTAFSLQEEYFVTIFQDVTAEMQNLHQLKKQTKQIETAYRDLDIIFNSTHDAMFLAEYKDETLNYIRLNSAHQKLSGFRPQDIQGKTPVEVWGTEIGPGIQETYLHSMMSGINKTYEEKLVLNHGDTYFLTSLTPVYENGAPKYLVGSRKDVTELKKMEKDRDELLLRLESMFNEHSAVMMIIEPETGKILDANPAACTFYEYSREELLTMDIHEINVMPKEEVEKRRSLALNGNKRYFLFPHRLKSGQIRLVDVYSSPIRYAGQTQLFSIIFDVTDRERYREDLYFEKELLSTTLESIGDGTVTTDIIGRITSLNKAAEEIIGWSDQEVKNHPFKDIFKLKSEETGKPVEDPVSKVLLTGKIIGLANHTVLINKQGIPVPIADSAAPIKNKNGQTFGVVMVFRDVTKDKEQQEQILFLSYHDPLTGLYNRRFLEREMELLDEPSRLPLAVIMGDVNGLKITNDVFSHEAGDRLLQKAAHILMSNCGRDDVISRWGGDEFLILQPNTTMEAAQETIQKMKSQFAPASEGELHLSVALGCAVKTNPEESLQRVLQEAEESMYHQKLLEGKSYRNSIINTLLATLYEKSMETEEHAERLRDTCRAIGSEFKFSEEEMSELSLLAILHDIGKVGINQNILQKPGPLTPEEWEEMRRHPEIGYRIAQNTPELMVVAEYILSHHERWDGKGYPRGISGDNIPVQCRILAVADAYDAMTNDRVYRKALKHEEAISELEQNAGTQFDPYIVELFVKTMNEYPFA
ncbi:PAS domain S-box protein [Caproiciproducens faecalis]|uniref:PAS domain S-box protein n=1 Tax=Caproiciproducens faecalis TaxID=2820301 RepID=A0ABS7DK36_9FIRM|nr:PAS domain S-box protein [Caproiciproducens faecalis]MBW7571469.1 PAS domain S-box protein [Caproiciproducens faecalis]